MDRKILNIVNRVIGGKTPNRRIFESKKEMCSECGSTMREGECMECGNTMREGECMECGSTMREGECMECGYTKETELGEKLHGKQHKLDKNKNGRLDREDFKMLRRKTEVKEKLYGRQSVLDKNRNKKIDAEDFKILRKESVYGVEIDNKTHYFKENEVINIIENIVLEEKKKKTSKTKIPNVTKSSLEKSKKENDDYIASVVKKMKDYLKDGSKGEYEMMPKGFPKGNGELEKMKKMAYTPSDTAQEYIDNFTAAGLENLDYDEIHPNEDWVTDNLVGSSRTGNNPEWANAVETGVGERRNKIRQNNLLAKVKRMAYQKDDQPVKIDSSGEDFADNVDSLLKKYGSKPSKSKNLKKESFETKQDNVLNEDLNKMKKLIGYGKKTQ
jgi:hypothetical protein